MKQPINLSPAEYSTITWYQTMPVGSTLDDALDPAFWMHVTKQLRPGHEIKVVPEDRTWWAHLMVRDVGKNEAMVAVIASAKFDKTKEKPVTSEYGVKWRSPTSRYGVFRQSDNEWIEDGFETKEAAFAFIAEREQSMAA